VTSPPHSTEATAMVVITAADPATGPIVEIHTPVRVPLGLHGSSPSSSVGGVWYRRVWHAALACLAAR
jgi:hypothetical protein